MKPPIDPSDVEALFDAALEERPEYRRAFVEAHCKGRPELFAEVWALLEADEEARDFLEKPIVALVPQEEPLSAAARIGRFAVLSKVGEGGMGVVYAAYDENLDRRVALKFIGRGIASADGRARLLREAQAMAKLAHPNVVPIYEVAEHDGRLVVAMEYVEGQTLRAFCREAPRPWEEVLAAGIQAGRGIAAAHDAGLVHRDIKPDNILIGKDRRARVVDFGLARRRASRDVAAPASVRPMTKGGSTLDELLTRAGTLMGTPNYMAPEQLDGDATAKSDQWSFCVTLHEMLYGELPFDTVNRYVLRSAPPGSTVPAWVRSALVRGLSVNPEDRWPNIHALIDTLDEMLVKEDYPGHSVSRRERFRLVLLLGILPITIAFFVLGRFAPMTRPIHLFWVGALSTTAILVALVVFRRPLSKNEVNRRIGYLIALATGVTFVHRGLAVVMNEPVERAMVTDLLLYTGVLSAAALVTRRRFLFASGICVVGAVLAALLPAYATAVYLVAMQASVATVLWFWRRRA